MHRYSEFVVAAITRHIDEIVNDLLEFKDYYYVLTASDSDLPLDWIKQTYPEQGINYRLGSHACLIFPHDAKKALKATLIGGGDAFYICREQPSDKTLDIESYGCLADYSIYPDNKTVPEEVIINAIEEIEKFNAMYHVSNGFIGVLLIVTKDVKFKQILEKYFGDVEIS